MYKLIFFVPHGDCEKVKRGLFEAGAGRYENYDCCSWEVVGQGQFRPLKGSNPTFGKEDELETIPEYRVEMIVEKEHAKEVIKTLKTIHPYEVPAFQLIELVDADTI